MNCNMETTMRVAPKKYFDVLSELLEIRLKGLEAEEARKPMKPLKFRTPGM
jgi:hypothetical protein